jgi:hypothetical protein
MTAKDEGTYRLQLAGQLLREAQAQPAEMTHPQALLARGAIENAAKAILACFASVPRTHEPAQLLLEALQDPRFPQHFRSTAEALVPILRSYGMKEHVLLSYGDEEHRIDPASLVTVEHARASLDVAGRMVSLATQVLAQVFPAA